MQKRMPKTLVTSCFIILSLFLVYNLELFQHEKNGKVSNYLSIAVHVVVSLITNAPFLAILFIFDKISK